MTLREKLYREHSPYDGFEFTEDAVDLQGWGSGNQVLIQLIEKLKPHLILEVGSWKGLSAIHMAELALRFYKDIEIICIDTFNGSPEHWLAKGENLDWYQSLKLKNGRPMFYQTFMANVMHKKLERYITPFPIDSFSGFQVLSSLGCKAKLIYIDGDHHYDSCYRDLCNYFTLLDSQGVILVDDYLGWEGVTKAVHKFTIENEVGFASEFGKAVIFKGIQPFIVSKFINNSRS